MKTLRLGVVLSTLCVSGCLNIPWPGVIAQDSLVKIYESGSLLPHGGETYTFEFKNHRYSNFKGVGYAVVPEKDAIVFFTQREGWSTYLHLAPMHNGEEATIKLGENTLGSGFGRPPDDFASHYVERIDGDKFYFIEKAWSSTKDGMAYRSVVDVKTGEFKELGAVKLADAKASGQARPVASMSQEPMKKEPNQPLDPTPPSGAGHL
jgi:hypothetical protein